MNWLEEHKQLVIAIAGAIIAALLLLFISRKGSAGGTTVVSQPGSDNPQQSGGGGLGQGLADAFGAQSDQISKLLAEVASEQDQLTRLQEQLTPKPPDTATSLDIATSTWNYMYNLMANVLPGKNQDSTARITDSTYRNQFIQMETGKGLTAQQSSDLYDTISDYMHFGLTWNINQIQAWTQAYRSDPTLTGSLFWNSKYNPDMTKYQNQTPASSQTPPTR